MTFIESKFVYYTECNLATLEHLQMKKSSSKSEIKRQTDICNGMLNALGFIDGFDSEIARHLQCPRVAGIVKSAHAAATKNYKVPE